VNNGNRHDHESRRNDDAPYHHEQHEQHEATEENSNPQHNQQQEGIEEEPAINQT
jgi:hypothetical protein